MGRFFIRQDAQIASTGDSLVGFLDNVASGATMESAAVSVADDLNNIRSQLNRVLDATGGGNWYDAITQVNGSTRGLLQLGTDLNDIEVKPLLCPVSVLTNVTVGAATNVVTLSQASSETPTAVAAVDAGTALGAIVATLPADVGTHSLNAVAGTNALSPKNLVWVRDAVTKDAISSNSQEVFGLIQAESGTVDGDAFNDTDKQAQISFVRNNGSDVLEAVPASDIQGKVIEYTYPRRVTIDTLPEDCIFPSVKFADRTAASVDVTRQISLDNQGATPVLTTTDALADVGSGLVWKLRDALSADLFSVTEGSAGGTSTVQVGGDVDVYDNNAASVNFASGATIASGTQGIHIGETVGTIESELANDLRILGGNELFLDDGNQSGSTWAQTNGVKLSDTTAEWDAYEVAFGGEVSILNAIVQANSGSARSFVESTLTANVPAGTDINGPGTPHANTSVDLLPYDQVTFATDVQVFLNGELVSHADGVSAGGTPADGDLQFSFNLKGTGAKPDELAVTVYGQ